MKKYKYLLMGSLLLLPIPVLAGSGSSNDSLGGTLFMEAFVTIHMSLFVLLPLSKIFGKENSKKLFWILFGIRVAVLLFFDFFVTPAIAILDFFAVFIGAFIVVPVCAFITKTPINRRSNQVISVNSSDSYLPPVNQATSETILKCRKCGGVLNITDKFCSNCGAAFDGDNVSVSIQQKDIVLPGDFDPMFSKTDEELLEEFIHNELKRVGMGDDNHLIPREVLKRKNILNIIFSILVFVYISLIFFHFPIYTYIIGIIILFLFSKITGKYDFLKHLKKEIKSRPSEKISNIIMGVKSSLVIDNQKSIKICSLLVAVILSLALFVNPRVMYEKTEGGYAVRFYTFGLTNFKTAVIPGAYKGEDVVSLRGNTFSNMPFLESVSIPDSIREIRGQAFKNDVSLSSVNIPSNLQYLGGGAFYKCKSLTSISLPDSLTYMGGETFYGASSLESVKLSNNLTEIRGNSFEECTSLKRIEIPDKVTRIGGHAFYGDTSLEEVIFTQNSQLSEIGSSAFRQCTSLYEITIPNDTNVNFRAFKESPTKVNRMGNLIDHSRYSYNTTLYLLSGGDYQKINKYWEDAFTKNSFILLKHAVCSSGDCSYYLTYKDDRTTLDIVLKRDKSAAYINDNIAIEVDDTYQFYDSNSDSLWLEVYYN